MKLGLPPVAASGDDFKTATAHEGLRENRLVDARRMTPRCPHIGDTVHTVSLSRNSFRTQLLTSLLLCWAIQFASLKAIFTLNFTPQNGCSLINSLTGKGGLTHQPTRSGWRWIQFIHSGWPAGLLAARRPGHRKLLKTFVLQAFLPSAQRADVLARG